MRGQLQAPAALSPLDRYEARVYVAMKVGMSSGYELAIIAANMILI
jgi:hypothetical protein